MYIILRLSDVRFINKSEQNWLYQTDNMTRLITSFEEAGMWEWFRYYGKLRSQRLKVLPSIEQLVEKSKSWKQYTHIFSDNKTYNEDFYLSLRIKKEYFYLTVVLNKSYVDTYQDRVLDCFTNFVCALHTKFQDIALIGPSISIDIFDVPFKQVYPPRVIHYFGNSSIINYVSKKFFQQYQNFEYEKFERLLTLPMPEGCYREERGDLVIFRWAENLNDNEYLQERLAIREQWLVEAIDPPIDSLYNSLGDRRVFLPDTAIRNEFVTEYDPKSEAGYKLFLVNHDWTIDEELFAQMASWLKAGKLPDGKPLKKLHILPSDRESALFIYERAKAIGIEGVYYLSNGALMWNPFVTHV